MFVKFKIIGLQRTGTNWLNELIKENFIVEEDDGNFWKHLTPFGTKANARLLHYKGSPSDLILQSDTFYIATSKDYDLWLKSLTRNCEDFYVTHTSTNKKFIYDSWHKWIKENSNKKNLFYRNYMNWLTDWETSFEEIEQITGWERRHDAFKNVSKVPQSPNFKLENYIGK